MALSIFVSYSHRDAGLVTPVVGLLRATRDLVFQDVSGLTPGMKWREQMEEALRVANLVIVFWCHHSSRSEEVRKEYELALGTKKDLLPVILDATPLPKELTEFQWVDFRGMSGLGHRSSKMWMTLTAIAAGLVAAALSVFWLTSASPVRTTRQGVPPSLAAPPIGEAAPPAIAPAPEKAPSTAVAPPRITAPRAGEAPSRVTPPPSAAPPVGEAAPPPIAPAPTNLPFLIVTSLSVAIWILVAMGRKRLRRAKMAATLRQELRKRDISSV